MDFKNKLFNINKIKEAENEVEDGQKEDDNSNDDKDRIKDGDENDDDAEEEVEDINEIYSHNKSKVKFNIDNDEEEVEERLEKFDNADYDRIKNELEDLERMKEEGDAEYLGQLEQHYNDVKENFITIKELEKKASYMLTDITLQGEKLDEIINITFENVSFTKEEIGNITIQIKAELGRTGVLSSLFSGSIIDKIFSNLFNVDLTKISKFSKYLIESKDRNIIESLNMIRDKGGQYLKKQGAVLYFLHLLKERYKETRIPQEGIMGMDNVILDNQIVDADDLKIFQTKVRVIYGEESYLINLDTDEKKQNFTFKNLKDSACEFWNIPKDIQKKYHIVNGKLNVFCPGIKVWDIHKIAIENSRGGINFAHIELLDKMSIFMDRQTDINRGLIPKSKIISAVEANNINHTINLNIISSYEIFQSEIEEYVSSYRRFEAVKKLFYKDKEKEKIKLDYKNKLQELEVEKVKLQEQEEDGENIQERLSTEQLDKKFKDMKHAEKKNMKENLKKMKRKLEPPIYISMFDIYKFRLMKFWFFLLTLLSAISVYYYYNHNGTLNIEASNEMRRTLDLAILFNPVYKNFIDKGNAYTNKDFPEMIRSKQDVILYLDLLFNNLAINSNLTMGPFNQTDKYNNYFSKQEIVYEMFSGVRLMSKLRQHKNSTQAQAETIFQIPSTMTPYLYYFTDISSSNGEETRPIILNTTGRDMNLLTQFEEEICVDCFTNQTLKYALDPKMTNIQGKFGIYANGGYFFVVNPYLLNRKIFHEIVETIKIPMILNDNCNAFIISFNVLNIYYATLIPYDIIFEFSVNGDVQTTVQANILDTGWNPSPFWKIIMYFTYFQQTFFALNLIARIIMRSLVSSKAKKVGFLIIIYDSLLFFLFIVLEVKNLGSDKLYSNIMGLDFVSFAKISHTPLYQNPIAWKYFNFNPVVEVYDLVNQLSCATIFLMFFRVLFYLSGSPLIKYIIALITTTLSGIMNIMTIFIVFSATFTLVFHILLGQHISVFTDLSSSFLMTLSSILGSLETKYFSGLSTVQNLLIIIFLIIIKFILYTFVFAIILQTYETIRTKYRDYKKKDHYKLVGETIFLFVKYMFVPISFYFMYKDYKKYKSVYAALNLQSIVAEGDLKQNITFHKMIIEKREVFVIHQKP
jgi:hypothetical protein